MECLLKFWFLGSLVVAAANGNAIVSGTVFCDQCKDGQISIFDFPIRGIRVEVVCPSSDGEFRVVGGETSNWFGGFAVRFGWVSSLIGCYAQIAGGEDGGLSYCAAAGGPPKALRLVFQIFGFQMYTVDPLLSQPLDPMSFCPPSFAPPPLPQLPPLPPLPQLPPSPQLPPFSPLPQLPPLPPFPGFSPVPRLPFFPLVPPASPLPPVGSFPPLPQLPPLPPLPFLPPFPPFPGLPPQPPFPPIPGFSPVPRLPFFPPVPPAFPLPPLQASACTYRSWITPEYRCYWKAVTPDTKVAVVFGAVAARAYGTDVTLGEGLMGRGDPYRTLLREATAALLNSYDGSSSFPDGAPGVIQQTNAALMGSTVQVLRAALSFMRANSGETTNSTCRFSHCPRSL